MFGSLVRTARSCAGRWSTWTASCPTTTGRGWFGPLSKVWTWASFTIGSRRATRSPGGRPPIRRWCWQCGCMRRWRRSARRGRSTDCASSTAYRWLCGGAPINHDLLATFRRENAAALDRLLTQSLTGLIAEKVITLEELTIDGTKVRAGAGRGSMSKRKRLESIAKAVAERVAELKDELEKDPAEPERRRKRQALQAAEERARPVERAHQKLAELAQEQAERAKTHAQEEAEKGEPKVSVSDPEARLMRLADGAVAPAWNVQVATANGFIVVIDPTDRRKDGGLAPALETPP